MKRLPGLGGLFGIVVATACGGGSGNGGSSGADAGSGTGDATPICYDAQGNVTSTCAVPLDLERCPLGDANACAPLTKVEIHADDGTNGVCVHFVFDNECGREVYANTCAELALGQPFREQCWTSSIPSGTIDLSQCHATGKVWNVTTTSSGELAVLNSKCPAPQP